LTYAISVNKIGKAMSGHSKWAGIKHKKAAVDAARGKLFSKLNKEITVAAKLGGGDPDGNPRLRLAIQKAKEANMPGENIKKAIARGTGEIPGASIEEVVYEGYGPGGVAMLIEAMTDNRKRATSEIRHILSKGGGSMGEAGCVSWMFSKKGVLTIERSAVTEDELLDIAITAGAEDIRTEDNEYEITTEPSHFEEIKKALEEAGITPKYAEIAMVPQSYIEIGEKEARQVLKLVESLEENEDVQHVWSNLDIPDQLLTGAE
jgi:YebC/PmpR family DNA-binding regulatory protein